MTLELQGKTRAVVSLRASPGQPRSWQAASVRTEASHCTDEYKIGVMQQLQGRWLPRVQLWIGTDVCLCRIVALRRWPQSPYLYSGADATYGEYFQVLVCSSSATKHYERPCILFILLQIHY